MTVNDELLRVPEVARRLGIDGVSVYGLIDRTADAGSFVTNS